MLIISSDCAYAFGSSAAFMWTFKWVYNLLTFSSVIMLLSWAGSAKAETIFAKSLLFYGRKGWKILCSQIIFNIFSKRKTFHERRIPSRASFIIFIKFF